MRDGTGFSGETRERVLAAARELRWVPSGSARGLAVRRSGIVGLLFPDLDQAGEAQPQRSATRC
jgi:LacI family transcriptional regulator